MTSLINGRAGIRTTAVRLQSSGGLSLVSAEGNANLLEEGPVSLSRYLGWARKKGNDIAPGCINYARQRLVEKTEYEGRAVALYILCTVSYGSYNEERLTGWMNKLVN